LASAVDICNLALSHVANRANITSIDPPDQTVEADHCARFYPIALGEILESHEWRFATRRVALSELLLNPVDHWQYAYAYPNLCVRPVAVLMPESTDDTAVQEYTVESDDDGSMIIYANIPQAVLKYIALVNDSAKFSPLFVVALGYLLGSHLAGVLPKDLRLKASLFKTYHEVALPNAMAADARGRNVKAYGRHTPGHLSARGVSVELNPHLRPGTILR